MNPVDVLREEREEMPAWLRDYRPQERFNHGQFFGSRNVYYPGCGNDGHPLELFGKSHAAHCFVFVDYGFPERHFYEQLSDSRHPGHPQGYEPLSVRRIDIQELGSSGWVPHHEGPRPDSIAATLIRNMGRPFGLFSVHQRLPGFDSEHGPERIAILVLGADGFAGYDGLYCQGGPAPYAVVLQDHGFGGNWHRFGGPDSILYQLAAEFNLPTWLLAADTTKPWPGYTSVSGISCGGMHNHERRLWKREGGPYENRSHHNRRKSLDRH